MEELIMRVKKLLAICSLSLVTMLSGCGSGASSEMTSNIEETTSEEALQDITHEATSEESFEETIIKASDNASEETSTETNSEEISQDASKTENATGTANDDTKANALAAYQQILRDAPALEGNPEELQDASFGYEQNMEKYGKHYDDFAITDIDQDGTPELIAMTVINTKWTPVSIYTYANGNAVLLNDPLEPTDHGTFELNSSANGICSLFICKNNHVHKIWHGSTPVDENAEENYGYTLSNATLSATDCTESEGSYSTGFTDISKPNTAANIDAITQ